MNQYYQDNMLLGMNPSSYLHRYAVNGKVSGNLACISEIKNAAVVLYSPRGCGFHYRCHVRSGQSPVYELECADLRNNDVIFGGEKKLTALLQKVEREQKPEIIFLLPSVVSDIINDDLEGWPAACSRSSKQSSCRLRRRFFRIWTKATAARFCVKRPAKSRSKSFLPVLFIPAAVM